MPDVASERAGIRRRRVRRDWRRVPKPFAIALLLHLAALWWLHQQMVAAAADDARKTLLATLEAAVEAVEPEQPPPEPELLEVLEFEVEPIVSVVESEHEPTEVVDSLGLGGVGGGRGGGLGTVDVRASGLSDLAGVGSAPFRDYVADLRQRGVEVAFVVDATGSMQAFIDRARDAIDALASDLSAVVPGVRLAIVAYRDLGDDWVTSKVDFADHPWRVSNFLYELQAAGGMRTTPDFEEAVEEGLRVATQELSWTDGARQVVLLVGDAPWHDEDTNAVMSMARKFSRGDQSVIDTIYVGSSDAGQITAAGRRARDAWAKLAEVGDGHAFELLLPREPPGGRTEPGQGTLGGGGAAEVQAATQALHRQVIDAAFGSQWSEQVESWVRGGRRDVRATTVARHVARGDRKWLEARLLDKAVHPELVAACHALFDGRIAATCYRVVADEQRPEVLRWALLSVLRRELADARGLPFDPRRPVAEQTQALAQLKRVVSELPGAAAAFAGGVGGGVGGVPPPPPPPPGGR